MSKKLREKAGLIQLPPLAPAPVRPEAADVPQKTAPGTMLRFMTTQSAAVQEAEDLRERLKSFDGASPVRTIDPRQVRLSKYANRHPDSFATAEFAQLKQEIEAAGGNVQPVKVRPVADGGADGAAYELVYGHRRLRACLELGLPVRALVEAASDRELFEAMERENRGRQNLSAWEQGQMYRRALDAGLYPSLRQLSESLGVDVSQVSKAVSLARLPETVMAAFTSPLRIQFRWAQPLAEALQKDPDGILERARQARLAGMEAAQAFAHLTGGSNGASSRQEVRVDGKVAAVVIDERGATTIRFARGALTPEQHSRLLQFIGDLLQR